jgi:hypothetical protein
LPDSFLAEAILPNSTRDDAAIAEQSCHIRKIRWSAA